MFRKVFLASVILIAGCSGDTPASPSTSVDGVWRIISIQRASQVVQPAPTGAQYQVAFDDDRILLRVDCNTCNGPFTTKGSTLTIGPALACTRAGCATASYETAVVSLLSGDHQMSATLHNLTLSSNRGVVLLQK